jgi:hypothetical protein
MMHDYVIMHDMIIESEDGDPSPMDDPLDHLAAINHQVRKSPVAK